MHWLILSISEGISSPSYVQCLICKECEAYHPSNNMCGERGRGHLLFINLGSTLLALIR